MGFTPSLAVGVWAGNNDNAAMKPGADGIFVAAPIWRSFMDKVLNRYPIEQFPKYEKEDAGKPILNGKLAGDDIKVCKMNKKRDGSKYCLANDSCPDGTTDTKSFSASHDILYYVNKDDPRGDYPKNPDSDPQYAPWEKGLDNWLQDNHDFKGGSAAPTKDCKSSYFDNKNNNSSSSSSDSGSTPSPADQTILPTTP